MKTVRYILAVALILMSAAGATGKAFSQGVDAAGGRVVIDLNAMGETMAVPMGAVTFPDGTKFELQQWGETHIREAMAELRYCFDAPEKTYLVTNSPAPWVTLAVMEALAPLEVRYLYPRADGVELEMFELEKGTRASNYDVVFEVVSEGDNVYINLNSDRPESLELKQHTFDVQNLSKVMIPEIPAGKHLYIHGKGMFGVLVCVAGNYVKDARSVSLAAHDTDYTCAFSRSEEKAVGEVTPRTRPNNL